MEYLIPPWRHQLEAIEKAKEMRHYALFFEMGAGKTMTAINILRHRMNAAKRYARTLIFCPPIVISNWKEEFKKNSKIPEDKIVLLQGTGKKRLKLFNENAFTVDPVSGTPSPVPCFFVTNYESLLMPDLFYAFCDWKPDAVIFDESHKLKNHSAKRSKLAERLANPKVGQKPLTYLLSGSPVLNSPGDLFMQFLILDGGATFGKNYFVFRGRYFIDRNAGMPKERYFPDWVIRPGSIEEINKLIFKSSMRVTKEECMDLPDEVSVTIQCGMTFPQKAHYEELRKDFVTYVNDKAVVASLAIVKALRLMQITSGFLPVPSFTGEEAAIPAKMVYEETAKEEALEELIRELTPHSKVIIWAVWHANYESIRKVLEKVGVKYVEVHGQVGSAAKRQAAVEAFQTDDSIRVYLGHPGSGGIGINLVVAPYSIFYSRNFSLEHWLQARARNHRGGQAQKVTHYDLVCTGTIDEEVVEKLAEKAALSEALLTESKNLTLDEIVLAVQAQAT